MDYRYMPFYVQGSMLSGLYFQPWEENQDMRDLSYLKEMYPKATEEIQQMIDKECDRQEFEGSMLYDEYPDKLTIRTLATNIHNQIKKNQVECQNCEKVPYMDEQCIHDLITVMLLNEMYSRRQMRRYTRKKLY